MAVLLAEKGVRTVCPKNGNVSFGLSEIQSLMGTREITVRRLRNNKFLVQNMAIGEWYYNHRANTLLHADNQDIMPMKINVRGDALVMSELEFGGGINCGMGSFQKFLIMIDDERGFVPLVIVYAHLGQLSTTVLDWYSKNYDFDLSRLRAISLSSVVMPEPTKDSSAYRLITGPDWEDFGGDGPEPETIRGIEDAGLSSVVPVEDISFNFVFTVSA